MAKKKKPKKEKAKPSVTKDPLLYDGPPEKKQGRVAKLDKPMSRKKFILDRLRKGATQRMAAESVGISMSAFTAYKANDPEFARQVNQARAVGHLLITDNLVRLALEANQESVQLKASEFYLSHCSDDFRKGANDEEDDFDPDASYL